MLDIEDGVPRGLAGIDGKRVARHQTFGSFRLAFQQRQLRLQKAQQLFVSGNRDQRLLAPEPGFDLLGLEQSKPVFQVRGVLDRDQLSALDGIANLKVFKHGDRICGRGDGCRLSGGNTALHIGKDRQNLFACLTDTDRGGAATKSLRERRRAKEEQQRTDDAGGAREPASLKRKCHKEPPNTVSGARSGECPPEDGKFTKQAIVRATGLCDKLSENSFAEWTTPVDRRACSGISHIRRRGGRAVECTGLENRQGCEPFVGSNPTLSAIYPD